MDKRLLAAFVDPAPFRLLGRSLYPWCLKYRLRLHAFNSPLVDGHRDVTPADLLLACQICAEEPIGGQISWVDKLRLMRLADNPAKFEMLLHAFAGYILIDDWPKFWEQTQSKGATNTRGLPWVLNIVTSLIKNGIDEKRAWEMPECQAIWYNSAFAIHAGAEVSIMSPEEEAYIEEQLKAEADQVAKSAEEKPQ